MSPKKGTNFLWAPAYSPEPPQSSGVLHLVLRDSFLRQPIRFKETFQQPMRIKQSVGILAIMGSTNKHTIGSGQGLDYMLVPLKSLYTFLELIFSCDKV